MSTNRTKLFLENFLVYGLGGVMSKLIPMIMLPVITRLYPNSEYIGLNDLNQTFISFAQALAVCGMYDAMFRIFFDYKESDEQKKVCSTAMVFVTTTSIILTVLCVVLKEQIAAFYFGDSKYDKLVLITALGFLLSATNQIVSAPTRIQNKRKIFLVTNTISPFISYGICIPMILAGHYLYALPLGAVISAIVIEVSFGVMNRSYFQLKSFDKKILKELLVIGIPLMPNFIVYWLYNSADKIMIAQLMGNSYTGIYAVASKIGHISNLIYTAFSGGWLFFAYSTMNDDDQVQLKSDIFEYLGAIAFGCTVLVMGFSKLAFKILFPEAYFSGYLVMPYLFIAPLLLMLYQVTANQFSIVKKTYLNLMALSIGAVVNLILNYVLIQKIGIEGASIATVVGYIVSVAGCILLLRKMKLIVVNPAFYINAGLLIGYFVLWRFFICSNMLLSIVSSILVALVFVYRYRRMIGVLIGNLKKK